MQLYPDSSVHRPGTGSGRGRSLLRGLLSSHAHQIAVRPTPGQNGWCSGPEVLSLRQHVLSARGQLVTPHAFALAHHAVTAQQQVPHSALPPVTLGFPGWLEERFSLGATLGKGGYGHVRQCTENSSGRVYACKVVPKVPKDASEQKRASHIAALKREVAVLQQLKGSLNVVGLEAVYEDADHVYMVQECCTGGELADAVQQRHYSERTVASYMRAVMRTLAQCHTNHILHRDVKPENFLLLDSSERAPLRAIDFGLAMPFQPDQLPLTNLGLEGTPWFMAPEALSCQVSPASDVWSAGVMAHQLLTGRMPFDDHRNPVNPSITAIWRSILNDPLRLDKPWWQGVSAEAKDFVTRLLDRDPAKRPTARQALDHPWLQGNSQERSMGKALRRDVVARIQRFSTASHLKRSVLQMVAQELLRRPGLLPMGALRERGRAVIMDPGSECLGPLYRRLQLDEQDAVPVGQVARVLQEQGFRLSDDEVARLTDQLDPQGTGLITKSALAASQLDWRYLQTNYRDAWLTLLRGVFESFDSTGDVLVRSGSQAIVEACSKVLPDDEAEVAQAVHAALQDAAYVNFDQALNFDEFVDMLRCGSMDSLELFDERLGSTWGSSSSLEQLNLLLQRVGSVGGSLHAANSVARHRTVPLESAACVRVAEGSRHSLTSAALEGSLHSFTQGPEWDMSMHGESLPATPRAVPALAPWRFEVTPPAATQHTSTAGAAAVTTASQELDRAGSGNNAVPFLPGLTDGVTQPGLPGLSLPLGSSAALSPTAFRFDVAPAAAPAAAPPAPVWRFDVAGPLNRAPLAGRPSGSVSVVGVGVGVSGAMDGRVRGASLYQGLVGAGSGAARMEQAGSVALSAGGMLAPVWE